MLWTICTMQNIEVVDLLIKLNADIDLTPGKEGHTALVCACSSGQIEYNVAHNCYKTKCFIWEVDDLHHITH